MLSLIIVFAFFSALAVHAGAECLARPRTMSAEWLAEHRASRAV